MRDRLKYGAAFGIMSLAVFGLAIMSDHVVTMVAWLYFGITLALVSLAYLLHRPDLFGKRKDGSVPVWSYLVYLSYYQLNHLSLAIYRLQSAEAPWHQISPGLFLGCRLRSSDKSAIDKLNITCVLDLTSEFSEVPFLRRAARYHNIPLL
ncbi:MAG TPA: hypothetical protein VK970_11415, partial [Candidatus Methylacidiphilales bacterium]|nr:hypothetical protein [Candidatus Methylacidiphilales bacterium]